MRASRRSAFGQKRCPAASASWPSGRYKLHYNRLTRASQVFDLSIDPGERTDLAAARPELTRGLLQTLEAFRASAVEGTWRGEPSPEEIEKLRSLGYVK